MTKLRHCLEALPGAGFKIPRNPSRMVGMVAVEEGLDAG